MLATSVAAEVVVSDPEDVSGATTAETPVAVTATTTEIDHIFETRDLENGSERENGSRENEREIASETGNGNGNGNVNVMPAIGIEIGIGIETGNVISATDPIFRALADLRPLHCVQDLPRRPAISGMPEMPETFETFETLVTPEMSR